MRFSVVSLVLACSVGLAQAQTVSLTVDELHASNSLTIAPTGDIVVNPTGNDVYPTTNYDINLGLITNKFLTLHAAELWVETLVAQSTMATIGGRLLVGTTNELSADLSDSASVADFKYTNFAYQDIVYAESNGNVEFFQVGHYAIVTADVTSEYFELLGDYTGVFTNGMQFVIADSTGNDGTWTVASSSYLNPNYRIYVTGDVTDSTADGGILYRIMPSTGYYRYYFSSRNMDTSGANQWYAGDAFFNTKSATYGWIDLYSITGMRGSSYGPAIAINERQSSTYNDWEPRAAFGNLNGVYGYASRVYGAAFGDADDIWIAIDTTNGIRMMDGSTLRAQWAVDGSLTIGNTGAGNSNVQITSGQLNLRTGTTNKITLDTSGNIALVGDLSIGANGALRSGKTACATGTGYWMSYNGGTPDFCIGNPAGARMTWASGALTLTSATINSPSITAGGGAVTIDSSGITITSGTGYGTSAVKWSDGTALYSSSDNFVADIDSGGSAQILIGTNLYTFYATSFISGSTTDLGSASAPWDELFVDATGATYSDVPPAIIDTDGHVYKKTNVQAAATCDTTNNFSVEMGLVTSCTPVGPGPIPDQASRLLDRIIDSPELLDRLMTALEARYGSLPSLRRAAQRGTTER